MLTRKEMERPRLCSERKTGVEAFKVEHGTHQRLEACRENELNYLSAHASQERNNKVSIGEVWKSCNPLMVLLQSQDKPSKLLHTLSPS